MGAGLRVKATEIGLCCRDATLGTAGVEQHDNKIIYLTVV